MAFRDKVKRKLLFGISVEISPLNLSHKQNATVTMKNVSTRTRELSFLTQTMKYKLAVGI